jgi:hypothetical protein
MSMILALLAAITAPQAAAPAAPVMPVSPVGAAAVGDPQRVALSLELAELLNSEVLTRAQLAKLTSDTLPKVFAQNPDMVAIEQEHPGASAAVVAAIGPVMVDYTLRSLPKLWREIAPIYARYFDADELRSLLAFYRSPTGVRVIDAMGRGADYGAALTRMMNEQSSAITTGELRNGASPGIAEVVRSTSAEDRQVMVALMKTSAGRKLPVATREVLEAVAANSARPDPAFEKQVETLTIDTLTKHMKKR